MEKSHFLVCLHGLPEEEGISSSAWNNETCTSVLWNTADLYTDQINRFWKWQASNGFHSPRSSHSQAGSAGSFRPRTKLCLSILSCQFFHFKPLLADGRTWCVFLYLTPAGLKKRDTWLFKEHIQKKHTERCLYLPLLLWQRITFNMRNIDMRFKLKQS